MRANKRASEVIKEALTVPSISKFGRLGSHAQLRNAHALQLEFKAQEISERNKEIKHNIIRLKMKPTTKPNQQISPKNV